VGKSPESKPQDLCFFPGHHSYHPTNSIKTPKGILQSGLSTESLHYVDKT